MMMMMTMMTMVLVMMIMVMVCCAVDAMLSQSRQVPKVGSCPKRGALGLLRSSDETDKTH